MNLAVTEYKVNIQKPIVFLHTSKEKLEIKVFFKAVYGSIEKYKTLKNEFTKIYVTFEH